MIPNKIIEINPIYHGKFLNFYNLELDNDRKYEMISRHEINLDNLNEENADAVDIIAFSKDFQKVLVIKEWRYPINDFIFSFPAGLRESDEEILETASRELFEETGLNISTLLKILPPAYQSAGMTNEAVASVICTADGELTNKNSTDSEIITPMLINKEEAVEILQKEKCSARCQMFLTMWSQNYLF